MPDLEFRIATSAELSGAKSVERDLERQIGRAKLLGQDYKELEAKLLRVRDVISNFDSKATFGEKLSAQFQNVAAQIPGFERARTIITELASGPLGFISAGITAIGSAFLYTKEAVEEFAKAEVVIVKLQAALAQNGQLTEENNKKYQELADTLQNETTIAGESWLAVMTRLTQQGVKPDEIDKYTQAVKHLAAIMGGDVETAAGILTRALNGNFSILQRYGITVSETATQSEKLNQAFQQLAQRGAGQSEAAARTLSGQWRAAKNEMSDMTKAVGQFVAETGVLQSVTEGLKTTFAFWREQMSHTVQILPGLTNNTGPAAKSMGEAARAAEAFAEGLKAIKTEASAAVTAVQALVKETAEYAAAQDRELDRQKDIELTKFRAGAHTRSGAANAAGEAAIVSKFEKQKSSTDTESLQRQGALLQSQLQAMVDAQQELEQQLAEIQKKSQTPQHSEDNVAKQAEYAREIANANAELRRILDSRWGKMIFDEGGIATSRRPDLEAAQKEGAGAVFKVLSKLHDDIVALTGQKSPWSYVTGQMAGNAGQVVSAEARSKALGNVESLAQKNAELSQTLDATQKANAEEMRKLVDAIRQNTQALKDRQRDAEVDQEKRDIESGSKNLQSRIEETRQTINAQIQELRNLQYEGMPEKNRMGIEQKIADRNVALKQLDQVYDAKSGPEVRRLQAEIEEIRKNLNIEYQKSSQQPNFRGPGAAPVPYSEPIPGVPQASVESITDTAQTLAAAIRTLDKGLQPLEGAIVVMADMQDRLNAMQEQLNNLRPV